MASTKPFGSQSTAPLENNIRRRIIMKFAMGGPNSRRWRHILLTGIAGAAVTLGGCGDDSSSIDDPNAVATLPAVADNLSINPTATCSMAGIGATKLTADDTVTILDAASGTTGTGATDKPYCLVKVKVAQAINIWVAMPTSAWNGRFRSEGGGVYVGSVGVANDSVKQGFVGVTTDTGHTGVPAFAPFIDGSFGMASPGVANVALQTDFAFRSEHLMAVIGKQLVKAFYAQDPVRSYWYGCSTGGRQGLMMAQRFPDDYDAILAGAPAIHWDRFQAAQIWAQVVMRQELAAGGVPGAPMLSAKLNLATQRAVATCDAADGVTDGVIRDPRTCAYDPTSDTTVTSSTCASTDGTCLGTAEATAIKKMWGGARDTSGNLLWPGFERGADLTPMAGATPFVAPIQQGKFWVYFDPNWDWTTLTYANFLTWFNDNIAKVGPLMATQNPDLSPFRKRGGKLIMYHGWADQLIMPEGTTLYWDDVNQTLTKAGVPLDFAKLYMVPGMGHCGGGAGPNQFGQGSSGIVPADATHDIFRALMAWSEKGTAPQAIVASKFPNDDTTKPVLTTRPLCVYPQVAKYTGSGSTDDAANFTCANP
jgi:pimeloyl-ACP methyl ester carboxylesterase